RRPMTYERWISLSESDPLALALKLNHLEQSNRQIAHLDLTDINSLDDLLTLTNTISELSCSGVRILFPLSGSYRLGLNIVQILSKLFSKIHPNDPGAVTVQLWSPDQVVARFRDESKNINPAHMIG